ncbi:hypothetical protein KC878_01535 [Candidatus Saccharibacteria bacterium]|nr:hypothetical protein [Candidatus Saccharibacteria bacterium]MCB9821208.1 hypothetical protein [Candidatus Nomurabacteria bacterium]
MQDTRIEAPLDKYKMPLPVITPAYIARTLGRSGVDGHHSNFNRRRAELNTPGGRALRALRVQDILVPVHRRFNEVCRQPDLSFLDHPIPGQPVFERVPLYHAAYIPTHGINPYADDPSKFVSLSPKQRALLGEDVELEGRFDRDNRYVLSEHIGNFMFGFMLDNFTDETDLENVSALSLKKAKQARLIREIMKRVVGDAAALAQPMYKRARLDRRTTRMRHCIHAVEVLVDLLDRAYVNRSAEDVFGFELKARAGLS